MVEPVADLEVPLCRVEQVRIDAVAPSDIPCLRVVMEALEVGDQPVDIFVARKEAFPDEGSPARVSNPGDLVEIVLWMRLHRPEYALSVRDDR